MEENEDHDDGRFCGSIESQLIFSFFEAIDVMPLIDRGISMLLSGHDISRETDEILVYLQLTSVTSTTIGFSVFNRELR